MPTIDKVKRSFVWLRKTLGIIDKTTLPGEVLGEIRPTIDSLGWFRYENLEVSQINAGAPTAVVASPVTPPNVIRVVVNASVSHSDTAVAHLASLNKRRNPGNFNIGLPTDRALIEVGEFCSLIGRMTLMENEFLIGQVVAAPAVGNLTLRFFFVDIEIGEYIPPL